MLRVVLTACSGPGPLLPLPGYLKPLSALPFSLPACAPAPGLRPRVHGRKVPGWGLTLCPASAGIFTTHSQPGKLSIHWILEWKGIQSISVITLSYPSSLGQPPSHNQCAGLVGCIHMPPTCPASGSRRFHDQNSGHRPRPR